MKAFLLQGQGFCEGMEGRVEFGLAEWFRTFGCLHTECLFLETTFIHSKGPRDFFLVGSLLRLTFPKEKIPFRRSAASLQGDYGPSGSRS